MRSWFLWLCSAADGNSRQWRLRQCRSHCQIASSSHWRQSNIWTRYEPHLRKLVRKEYFWSVVKTGGGGALWSHCDPSKNVFSNCFERLNDKSGGLPYSHCHSLQHKGDCWSHLCSVSLQPIASLHSSLMAEALTDVGGRLHVLPRLLSFTCTTQSPNWRVTSHLLTLGDGRFSWLTDADAF